MLNRVFIPAFFVAILLLGTSAGAAERIDKKAVQTLGSDFFEARPKTRFEAWDAMTRRQLLARAQALGSLPEGSLDKVVDILWKSIHKRALKPKGEMDTPYGKATWIQNGTGGKKNGLLIGLHGGGEGAGSAGEAAGNWNMPKTLSMFPQGIRLVHDTWNTVHGEAFILTLIEIAKARYEIDPDRVYVAGFSMGGTGSWHMAGRYPDLFAGAIPAHGVIMAPKVKVVTAEEVGEIQYGLLPNARNLPVYFYTGAADKNCEPGTFLFAWNQIQELMEEDAGGYQDIRFKCWPGLAHAFPPGEPSAGIKWIGAKRRNAFPEKLVWEYAEFPFPHPDDQDKLQRLVQHWFYWLHCARPVDRMHVTAIRKGNELDLEVTLAFPEDFTIYLNPTMIDVEQDVVVRVDGEEVYRGRPKPDLATILESLDGRLDRTMVFDRKVRIPELDQSE